MMWDEDFVFLRTKRRHILFKSLKELYEKSCEYRDREDWMQDYMPGMLREQIEDGFYGAMYDFRVWYETRKSRAKIHMRMVGKLLAWHHQSVKKLWDPSRPENLERIMDVYNN
jgi:hypothetical protein